jgi:hypothetical protein
MRTVGGVAHPRDRIRVPRERELRVVLLADEQLGFRSAHAVHPKPKQLVTPVVLRHDEQPGVVMGEEVAFGATIPAEWRLTSLTRVAVLEHEPPPVGLEAGALL